ncbi:hypothetical protein L9F63_011597 [Diploptera punctata]|uniref:Diphosphomevalonate decarboxylase n=1 Tax=Diploptera punctata TaxID=6984 RepID=A0AAD8EPR7_DIPPU|nr:hypothetical protein L9F63_011597 [Diploptera punctata]
MNIVTCIAPVNIAVIKYWGKRDEKLILPLNDSISATLNTEQMHAKTTVMTSPEFKEDKIWLNGKEESFDNPRLQNCLKEIRRRAKENVNSEGDIDCSWCVHICSQNNFPTAAGLASSAAGYACLVYALAELYKVEGDITAIARQGSGSACRSILGGFVHWHQGSASDGSDSIATQIVPESHWSQLRILILVFLERKLDSYRSKCSLGMQKTAETSELLKHRISHSVPRRIQEITEAIVSKNFEKFAELTMKDSNQFHAVCLDTFPPNVYMNDTSHAIVSLIHAYNNALGENKVAYTFDAGPNACLYLLEPDVPQFLSVINHVFPPASQTSEYLKGIPVESTPVPKSLVTSIGLEPQESGLLKYVIHTKVGRGPQILTESNQHLLNESGQPKF